MNQINDEQKVLLYDEETDFAVCINLMDNETREHLHSEFVESEVTNQEFMDEYLERHWEKFGENFEI